MENEVIPVFLWRSLQFTAEFSRVSQSRGRD
jgi:hypothetical protein